MMGMGSFLGQWVESILFGDGKKLKEERRLACDGGVMTYGERVQQLTGKERE